MVLRSSVAELMKYFNSTEDSVRPKAKALRVSLAFDRRAPAPLTDKERALAEELVARVRERGLKVRRERGVVQAMRET